MPPHVEQWVWLSDFHGFGYRDLSPSIGSAFLDISAKHYPERLGLFIVLGAPRIFGGLWHVLQPLVDPFTRAKIKFLPCACSLCSSGHMWGSGMCLVGLCMCSAEQVSFIFVSCMCHAALL